MTRKNVRNIPSSKKTIGILGGTFDPIHFGHLRAAQEIYERLELDEMRLMPCKQPPHRALPMASASDRLTMVRLAAKDTPFIVDDREMQRKGPSYSVDTLISLRNEFPKASLCLIIGVDAFLGLPTWHEWQKIIQLANIVVMHRSGWDIPTTGAVAELLAKHQLKTNEKMVDFTAQKITEQAITSLEIAASTIRSLIQAGHSPDFLLPSRVIDYIKQHQLYGFSGNNFLTHKTEVANI
jgi:nicotinate-nucleotide adenylyltransferase